MAMGSRKVVIIYGSNGGLSDCGKFAAAHTAKIRHEQLGLEHAPTFKLVAVSENASATENEGTVDVVDKADKAELENTLATLKDETERIHIHGVDMQKKLEDAVSGADAVVACIGNRQPFKTRYLSTGAKSIVAAMEAENVGRLVILSSFGIGNDFFPPSGVTRFWSCLLATVLRSARNDLLGLERVVRDSALDFLVVRPVGIDPSERPIGTWRLLTSQDDALDNKPSITMAKSDVGKFCLEQALAPTLSKTQVTITKGMPVSVEKQQEYHW